MYFATMIGFRILFLFGVTFVSCRGNNDQNKIALRMPGIHPDAEDQYWCYATELPHETTFFTQFQALASAKTAHHMILFGCEQPAFSGKAWQCGSICGGGNEQILFAWAKNAPPTVVPPDVGFEVGRSSRTKVGYLVLQIHYRSAFSADMSPDQSGLEITTTTTKPHFRAGVGLLMGYDVVIPPHTKGVSMDVTCQYHGSYPLHPFAYRTHAHALGTVITGYLYNGTWNKIGKGSPQWPQAFYPAQNNVTVKDSDYLAARCMYDSTDKDVSTHIGSTHNDEMCNFYFMYYTDFNSESYIQCAGNRLPNLAKAMPEDSLMPPPPNPKLDEAGGHSHHHGNADSDAFMNKSAEVVFDGEVQDWSKNTPPLGQVGGTAYDGSGNLLVFHRGSRVWDDSSFRSDNRFAADEPIPEATVVVYAPNGTVINKWGENMFYMPHGIYVDADDNIWLTDVALHQVMVFPKGSDGTALVLGKKFIPGDDDEHFCKPAAVVVIETGHIFVADGYCNSRIVHFDSSGNYVEDWGMPTSSAGEGLTGDGYPPPLNFFLVHDIVDVPEHKMLCVADRENHRVQCLSYSGEFIIQYHPPEFKKLPIYSLQYCPKYDSVVVLTGSDPTSTDKPQLHVINIVNMEVTWSWAPPQGLTRPHTVTANKDCDTLVVGEIGPNYLWKLRISSSVHSEAFPHQAVVKRPGAFFKPHLAVDNTSSSISDLEGGEGQQDFGISIIIAALLVVPVLVILIIAIMLRMKKRVLSQVFIVGTGHHRKNRRFDVGQFLGPSHKGFTRVSTEDDSEGELDPLNSDSADDIEEYVVPDRKV